ncbi:hypothetical protein [Pseudomonas sp. S09G 359]|jgi:hypothetical protein|uniref:hypothetical protein n=1 Tax=Pseudomonas sp. S09G 359 TaxID=2054919 RepID=UPI0012FE9B24|nr:hypothetical protein [Pseudomonas sp. S09G 359]
MREELVELVKCEINRRYNGYSPSGISIKKFQDGRGYVDFLLGVKPCSAEFSITQGLVYISRGPQDDFYNEYPLIKSFVDPEFDFETCCEQAFQLTKYNGRVTNLTLIKRREDGIHIEFKCNVCTARLLFDGSNAKSPWSKIL